MAIKDLLAVVDTGEQDEQFLRDAANFADFHGASLSYLILSAMPTADYSLTVGLPDLFLQEYAEAVEAKRKRIAEITGATREVRTISDTPGIMFEKAAVYGRYVDVVLFGPAQDYDYPPNRRHAIESILFASGRPVLILPNGYKPHAIDRLAVGWNATREATRALCDATAFAESGARIDVVVLDGKPSAKGHGSEPGADIAHHLARHGFAAEVVLVARGEGSDAEALVRGAREQGAPILALGAYGHSRFREMMLGGVTRDLLDGASIPLLFSH
ncbi:MAG: universal stress protein UspA [Erythrobacter sp.]|nr:universal stress protein UspA [Erythrobacter sp.]